VVDATLLVADQGMVVEALRLSGVEYDYTGGDRVWKGDVPAVRFDSERIRARGWRKRAVFERGLADAIAANIAEARQATARGIGSQGA
jgi:UDP-glucose 4-epimerase